MTELHPFYWGLLTIWFGCLFGVLLAICAALQSIDHTLKNWLKYIQGLNPISIGNPNNRDPQHDH